MLTVSVPVKGVVLFVALLLALSAAVLADGPT